MTDTLKSVSITNSDATPRVINATGVGAVGYAKDVSDWITPTAAGLLTTASTYKLIRVPTTIKLKSLVLAVDGDIETSTGLALDVGAYYSDSTTDGTPAADQGVLISANCFLAASTSFQSSATADVNALAAYSVQARNEPLWQGLGLSADPGGNIDIVLAVHTAATTGVSHKVGIRALYVE